MCRWTTLTASVVSAGASKHYLTIFCMRFCCILPVFGYTLCMRQTTPCIVFGEVILFSLLFSVHLRCLKLPLSHVYCFCVFEFYTFNIPTQNKTIKPTNAGGIFPYTYTYKILPYYIRHTNSEHSICCVPNHLHVQCWRRSSVCGVIVIVFALFLPTSAFHSVSLTLVWWSNERRTCKVNFSTKLSRIYADFVNF